MKKVKIALIGAGKISQEYLNAIKKNKNFFTIKCIIGRTLTNVKKLSKKYCLKNYYDNIDKIFIHKVDIIIVAVDVSSTIKVVKRLKNFNGIIFFEKPLGVNFKETKLISKILEKNKKNCFVALNRRFYSNIQFAKNCLKKDSSPRIISVYDQENTNYLNHKKIVIKNWMFANSVHLIDLLNFFARGVLKKITTTKKISKKEKIFISKLTYSSGDIGLYTSVWNRPGPWSISISSSKYFFDFNPLEKLRVRNFPINKSIDVLLDEKNTLKPGFHGQLLALKEFFKKGISQDLLNIDEYVELARIIKRIYK